MSAACEEQQQHKVLKRCKACQACRERKIRCRGQQPTCSYCQQQNLTCRYNDDKRQTSRVSTTAAVNSMSSKVAALEKIISRLEKQNQELARAVRVSGPVEALPSPIPPASLHEHAPPGQPSSTSVRPSPSVTGSFSHHGSDMHERERQGQIVGLASSSTFPSSSFPSEAPKSGWEPTSSRSDDLDSVVVSALHTRASNSIHGPTSAFHPQSFLSTPAAASSNDAAAEERGQSLDESLESSRVGNEDELRSQLFLFAASEKQKEHIYGMRGQYDLDGVDYDTAMHLLELHWNHQHCAYLSTYRPAILNSLTNNGPYASKLLLNAIYFSSSLNSDRLCFREDPDDPQSTGNRFLARFHQLLIPALERSSIPNAIAIGQAGSSLVACGRQTIGWLYSGLAHRMITDLGLHVDSSKLSKPSRFNSMPGNKLSFIDIEIQRRTFWGAYVNDKFQSLYFGRPYTLSAIGVEPPENYLDTYEEMELWAPYVDPENVIPRLQNFVPKPSYAISTFRWLLRLAQISAEIISNIYMPVGKMKQRAALDHFNNIKLVLQKWNDELPSHLQYKPQEDPAPPAHQFNLHTTYHTLRILLHRPFLPEGHLSHFKLDEHSTRQVCIDAALQIYYLGQAYRNTFTLRRAPYLFSYALFSAATVVPHDQIPSWSDAARNNMIGFFWNALSELQKGSNFGLRRPIKIIRDFMERAGIDITALASRPEEMSRPPTATNAALMDGNHLYNTNVSDPYSSSRHFVDPGSLGAENYSMMYPEMLSDNMDWLDDSINSLNESDDILYGLFRAS